MKRRKSVKETANIHLHRPQVGRQRTTDPPPDTSVDPILSQNYAQTTPVFRFSKLAQARPQIRALSSSLTTRSTIRYFSSTNNQHADDGIRSTKSVSIWLFIVSGLVFAMVVVGGLTRLTKSGLSMVICLLSWFAHSCAIRWTGSLRLKSLLLMMKSGNRSYCCYHSFDLAVP